MDTIQFWFSKLILVNKWFLYVLILMKVPQILVFFLSMESKDRVPIVQTVTVLIVNSNSDIIYYHLFGN